MRLDIRATENDKVKAQIEKDAMSDPVIQKFLNGSLSDIDQWIDNNVTDLVSAKTALKYLAKLLRYLTVYTVRES